MNVLSQFIPKKFYQWTLLFYGTLLLFIIWFEYITLIFGFLFIFVSLSYLPVSLILALFAALYFGKILSSLYALFKNKRKVIFKNALINTGLSIITIPIAVWYLALGFSALGVFFKPIMTPVRDTIVYRDYKTIPYQVVGKFPGTCNKKSIDDCNMVIRTEQEYQKFKINTHEPNRFPYIDFDRNILLVSRVSYGDPNCESLTRNVYRDDKNRQLLFITTIRPTQQSYFLRTCTSILVSESRAFLVPKLSGYTVTFQVKRESE